MTQKVFIFQNDAEVSDILRDIRIRQVNFTAKNTYILYAMDGLSVYCRADMADEDFVALTLEPWHQVLPAGKLYCLPIVNSDPISLAWKGANREMFVLEDGSDPTDAERRFEWQQLLGMEQAAEITLWGRIKSIFGYR